MNENKDEDDEDELWEVCYLKMVPISKIVTASVTD
jgi:hypothetical protein